MTEPQPEPEADRPTIAPFVGALVVVVLIVIGIVVANSFNGDGPTPEQDVSRAVVGQNDAMQRQNFSGFREFTCRAQQGTEADFLGRQRDSVAKNGERYVDGVRNVRIDGDQAAADATYHFDKTPDTTSVTELAIVREDGAWKVCSPALS
ncbi:lumazine-binding protein [Mycolicibacterium sp. P9-64]|uniref:Rv0361 family membrane protein n=1 Tax=Mycolicibacterium sp. P9-64 TaxID=2024612 RepID=UPI0011F085AC|nr:nuclear transport factor 2 family protein [Mycolicibacterium sp. P9-64]KAA0086774.1 lumazine-binding protein [Mycolicibacterium sp. P9-64]